VRAAEIETQDDLKAWLEGQSQEVCVWIAARAAARVLPLYCETGDRSEDPSTLTLFRATLTASTFSGSKDTTVKSLLALSQAAPKVAEHKRATGRSRVAIAANQALHAIQLSGSSALIAAAKAATDAMTAASRATNMRYQHDPPRDKNPAADARATIFNDARWAEAEGITATRPLWPEGMPDEIAQAWQATLHALPEPDGDQPDYRSFWVPWYQGLLDGKPAFPQSLTEAVALIPEDDWKQGDLHINNTVIPRLMKKYRSALSKAYPVDFTFDALHRVMRIIGIENDNAHLKDPAVVGAFVDDCDELEETLANFVDYAGDLAGTGNHAGVLQRAAQKVLDEVRRAKDLNHLRARHIVRLAGQLEAFSKEEKARDDLGPTLASMLDEGVGFLKSVTRKHFGPSYAALAPLADLPAEHVDRDAVIELFDEMIFYLEELSTDQAIALDAESLAILRDMVRETHDFRAAISEASADEFRAVVQARFTESAAGTGLAFGRLVERSAQAGRKIGDGSDVAIKNFRRVESFRDIIDVLKQMFPGGPPV